MADFTSTDLTNINAAIASGTMRVNIMGRMVEYRSLDAMMTIRNLIKSELAGSNNGGINKQQADFTP